MKFYRFLTLLLSLALSVGIFSPCARADSPEESSAAAESSEQAVSSPVQKAIYLREAAPYPVYNITVQSVFTELCRDRVNAAATTAEYRDLVYQYAQTESGSRFLSACAYDADLIDCGTFLNTDNCQEQLSYLTEVNGFSVILPEETTLFGDGETAIIAGDVIFWLDESGLPVNAGVVTLAGKNILYLTVSDNMGCSVTVRLNASILKKAGLERMKIVRVQYPFRESLVYLYCKDELGFCDAVICGILANLWCESEYDPTREENGTRIGYGICQWSFERRINLNNFCRENGLEPDKLYSQLAFMKYELKSDEYLELRQFLLSCKNTEGDARDAASCFCALFEQPGGGKATAYERAEYAGSSFWNLYGTGETLIQNYTY